jgi:1-acyl-sn-glycerol-3-phosphate acyltransferase
MADQAQNATPKKPITRTQMLLYIVCRAIAVSVTRTLFPGRGVGTEQLPRKGAYILAPVHRSNIDWIAVARFTRRRLRYIAKAEVWKAGPIGSFIEVLGAFPVHRDSADRESLNRCLAVLAGGEPLVLFPEGTRKSGAEVTDLREGAAYLALRAGVPIYPVGLAGTDRAMPRGSKFIRPTRITLVVGAPLNVIPPADAVHREAEGRSPRVSRSATHALTEELRQAMEGALMDALALEKMRQGSGLASTAVAPAEGPESASPDDEQ